ncbi:hypothetical protein TSUD_08310 [Trifolium subterraneum]|nr:hypothetical protein TSUD_08310 [Trifolium subterraneum]
MMDLINPLPSDGLDVVHQNGVRDEPSNSGEDGVVSNDLDPRVTETTETIGLNGNLESLKQLESTATENLPVGEIEGSNDNVDGNNITSPKEKEVKITVQKEQSKAQKGPVKNKNAKVASSSGVHATLVKNSKTGKDKQASSAVSNGTSALDPRPRQQPIKTKSFNDRQSQLSKNPSKSTAASSEVAGEKKKPISSKKGPLVKVQGEAESSLTNAEDAKPRRVGTLPNYGFSFRCGERAEKRREFLTKVEEKIQAKEEEKSSLQAKSKIPTTRAKSPKLGRKKNSTNSESDGNGSTSSRQGRLSLNEKVLQSNSTKEVALVHPKKPLRKSLPTRLTPEKINSAAAPKKGSATKKATSLSNAKGEEKTETTEVNEENSTLSSETNVALPLNVVPSDKPSEAESHGNGDILVEENHQLVLSQEPITTVH